MLEMPSTSKYVANARQRVGNSGHLSGKYSYIPDQGSSTKPSSRQEMTAWFLILYPAPVQRKGTVAALRPWRTATEL